MTQSMLVNGPAGSRFQLLGADNLVDVLLGLAPSGSVPVLTFATIVAASSARLVDFPLLTVPTGTIAYTGNADPVLSSVMATWVRMTSPTAVVSDNITIVKPLGGASREIWVRTKSNENYWVSLYSAAGASIDAVAGSDENFGNAAAPLQTWSEFLRRIGGTPFPAGITATIVGNLGVLDVLDVRDLLGPLTVVGSLVPVLTGLAIAGAGYTPRVAATNTPNQLTCSTALVWTTHVGNGEFVKMTSGAALGILATAVLDVGGNRARVGSFLNTASVEIQPAAGDTFDLVRVSQVTRCRVGGPAPVTLQNLRFVTNAIELSSAVPYAFANPLNNQFINCCFDIAGLFPGNYTAIGCQYMQAGGAFIGLGPAWNGGALFDPVANLYSVSGENAVTFAQGCIFQGCSLACSGGQASTNDTGFFDTVTTAIVVRRGGFLIARSTWGNTGAGNPAACTQDRTGSVILRGTAQTLTNAGGIECAMPITANTTWAAVRAAGGVKDGGATSNASLMAVA